MKSSLLLLAATLIFGGAALSLQSCGKSAEAAAPAGPTNALIALPDGSTMIAARGSATRKIGEWLASREGERATFHLRGFDEARPALTSEGIGDAAILATMLRAAPAAKIELAGDAGQARTLARVLEERGIDRERMAVLPAAGLGSVALTIYRGNSATLPSAGR